MIFLDTNVFLEIVGRVGGTDANPAAIRARALFDEIATGAVTATTSEAVLAETAFVLGSRYGAALPPARIQASLAPLILAQGLRLASKHLYLRALRLWAERPTIGFVDALTIAYGEQGDVQVASFDQQLLAALGVTPYWTPEAE